MKTIIITGLIGSGKSTLAQELGLALGPKTLCLAEPDEVGNLNPYLANYYADPKRWSFTIQMHMLALRFRQHLHAQWHALNCHGDAIMDSSYWQDVAYAHVQQQMGLMSVEEFSTYQAIYQAMTCHVLLPSVCIRILVSPTTSLQRIEERAKKRSGRKCEGAIKIEYLELLDLEIGHTCKVLLEGGTVVLDVPWDTSRETPKQRGETVEGLAARIRSLHPKEPLFVLHRRRQ